MNVTINGEAKQFADELTISDLLTAESVKMPEMVSVELNGEILERDAFQATFARDGDTIEFLYFMGGGA